MNVALLAHLTNVPHAHGHDAAAALVAVLAAAAFLLFRRAR